MIAVSEQFKLLATNRLDERCLATPAIARGELFVRTQSRLYCITSPQHFEVAAGSVAAGSVGSVEQSSAVRPTGDSAAIRGRTIPANGTTTTIYGTPAVRKKVRRKRAEP